VRSFNDEALILKQFSYGDSDRIIMLFTRGHGKVRAIAKGVRKVSSRKAGGLDLCTYSKVNLHKGKDLYVVTQAEAISTFFVIKSDLDRVSRAYLLIDVVNRLVPEEEAHTELFDLVLDYLNKLSKSIRPELCSLTIDTLTKLLESLGYWSQRFPKDYAFIRRYIESLVEGKMKSYEFAGDVGSLSG